MAEDVGQFELRPRFHPLSRRRHVQGEPIQGASGIANRLRRRPIARRGRQILATDQNLDHSDVDAALQKPQHMHTDPLVEPPRRPPPNGQAASNTVGSIGLSRVRPENRYNGARQSPMAAQDPEHRGLKHPVRALPPMPCSMRVTMRLQSTSQTLSAATSETATMDFPAIPPQRRQGIGRNHAGPDTRFGKRRSDRFAIFCRSLQLLGETS